MLKDKKIEKFVIIIALVFLGVVAIYRITGRHAEGKEAKYYITLPFNYKVGDSIEVTIREVPDTAWTRLQALTAIGAKVWTEEEWKARRR